jgi:hypothetical protein
MGTLLLTAQGDIIKNAQQMLETFLHHSESEILLESCLLGMRLIRIKG